ncbi:ABC transporter ATP-binding protein [Gracilimonas sediminicola]|uniref:ATP-binding cassette domain-containing protein n=1 Tax=Gracilimonas sediminicola TaxID=2952158 RepID=A0A9X2L414_9BACT|nr:ATP-binding cassette domain-containing protein [Gracilimonas sediminicola]MCP9291938.1 ATP-binding cassette domain-containing protein [Gracilimonas sediminicola]
MSEPAIQTENLTRKFGDFTAVDNITFEVEKGEIFGFLGANGAGKTTAMRMLTGLLTPTSGKALVSGKDVYRQAEAIKKKIGYMSQKFSLYDDLTSEENIRFYGGIYGIPDKELYRKIDEVINSLGLKDVRKKLVRSLPLGWKQKLAFSIAILHNPNIVFLDEPTGGVDPVTRRQFWEKIYEVSDRGITVFVTTHYMDEAEYCDRISIMVDGRMDAIGSPRELKENFESDSIEDVFIKLARGAERGEG